MNYILSDRSIRDRSKERNGDAVCHVELADGGWIAALVADGVGQCPCDWLASQTAAERFVALTQASPALPQDPTAGLKNILEQIDREIHATTGRGRGMKCAAVAVLWERGTDRAWFANIGDTRLYGIDQIRCGQISEDDSQAVVRRGPNGKPLISGGAVVVQRGITNALGSGAATVNASPCVLAPGASLVLSSDGFYGCSSDFSGDLVKVCSHGDLDDALSMLATDYGERNQDDATVLVLRRAFPRVTMAQVGAAIDGRPDPGIPIHAIASAIDEELPELVAVGAVAPVNKRLDFLDRSGLVLGRRRAEALLKQMTAAQWSDRHSFSSLVAMIRQQV